MDQFRQHILPQLPGLSVDEPAQFMAAFTSRQGMKRPFIVQPVLKQLTESTS